MTADQINICIAIGDLNFFPGTFDKRFARNLSAIAENEPEKELTEKQIEWMYRLLYKYRNQCPTVYAKHKDNPLCQKIKK